MSDNYRFDVQYEGDLLPYLKLLMRREPFYGFKIDERKVSEKYSTPRLVFFKYKSDKADAFPAALDAEGLAPLAHAWLNSIPYSQQPDHDGDNGKGWRLYNQAWGHIEPYGYQACAAIEPVWMMYGK